MMFRNNDDDERVKAGVMALLSAYLVGRGGGEERRKKKEEKERACSYSYISLVLMKRETKGEGKRVHTYLFIHPLAEGKRKERERKGKRVHIANRELGLTGLGLGGWA